MPPPGDLPDPGSEPKFPLSPALAGGFFTAEPLGKPQYLLTFPYVGKKKTRKIYPLFIYPSNFIVNLVLQTRSV